MKKLIVRITCVATLMSVMIQPLQAAMFDDVPNDYWARQYIEDLVAKNYMSGYGEGLFGPNNNLTRAETVKIILNALEKPIGEYSSASFKDVPNEHSLLNYIESAKDQSIVLGYEDGTFKPDRPVTRAEFMKILLEASGEVMNDPQVSQPFSDVPDDSWYRKYVYSALLKGYSQGYGNGKFGPNNNITRAEASKIISVFLKGGTPYVAEATDSEKKVLELINASRAAANKPALELDPKLSAIARYHSQDLYDIYHFWTKEVKQKYLSDHPGEAIPWTQHKDSSGRPFGEWFADKAAYYDFDYAKANQNIGFAFYDNKSVDELLTSIHDQMMKYDQANTILGTNDNYTHVGIGVLVGEDPNEIYLTEIFITR